MDTGAKTPVASINAADGALAHNLAGLLPPGPEARIVLDGDGDLIAGNPAGLALKAALEDYLARPASPLRDRLETPDAQDLTLKLTVAGVSTSFVAHLINLPGLFGQNLWLVILRQPNLTSHLIQALSASRALYKDIAQTVPGLVWELGADGRFVFVDGKPIGPFHTDTLQGVQPSEALSIPDDLADEIFMGHEPITGVDIWVPVDRHKPLCLSVSAKPLFDKAGHWCGSRGIALDVTAERRDTEALDEASMSLQHEAETDSLTGLLNRRGFDARMGKACRQLRAADIGGFLAVIDLDNFKTLNDSHGHHAGDRALSALANLLKSQIRSHDIAARLGGDEFVLWLDGTSEDGVRRVASALQAAMPAIGQRIDVPDCDLSLSIGITRLRPGQDDLSALLGRADRAMYAVKRSGRANHAFFEEMDP